jgi:hypothetical protein
MESEIAGEIGAKLGEVGAERVMHRNRTPPAGVGDPGRRD